MRFLHAGRWFGVLLFVLMVGACSDDDLTNPPVFDSELGEELQALLDSSVVEFRIPGVIMAIRNPEGASWSGASGLAIREDGTPMTEDTHVRIGSVTKTFTATVVLQLVDEGHLSLDENIDETLPNVIVNSDRITVRQLLEMRSGLGSFDKDSTWMAAMEADPHYQWSPEELIDYSNWTQFEPGERYDYNNANYTLLGMIVEEITSGDLELEIQNRILDPLGMQHTVVPTTDAQPEPFAHGYLNLGGTVTDMTFVFSCSYGYASGNMISTAEDQLVWIDALMSGRFLSDSMQSERFNMKEKEDMPGEYYGFGIEDYYGAQGHLGNYFWMYGAAVLRHEGWDFVLLANGQDDGGGEESHPYYIFWKAAEHIGLSPID